MSKKGRKYILAVDLGTSGPKSALVSTDGEIVDSAFEGIRLNLLPKGGAEQSPAEWWEAIIKTSKVVLGKGLVPVDDIVAVCCTTQWSGTVAVGRDGNPLMNAIIWMDSRGSQYVKDITGGLVRLEGYGVLKLLKWVRLTGGIPGRAGKDPIAHILFIREEFPETYKETYKFLEPKDYINLRFTGKFAASFDSIALHWVTDTRDISNVVYDDRLIRMSTVDRDKLPDLRRAIDLLGPIRREVAEELGLRKDVHVVMGAPDVQSAAVGSGAVRDYEAHLYIGTSSWLTCHVPFKKTDLFHNMASLPAAIPNRYFVANEQETAGACLAFLGNNILHYKDELSGQQTETDIHKAFDDIVKDVPAGSDKVIFTPWLYGERTPVEDHSLRAAFFNQSLRTTREHLIRAVYEGVAYNSRWLLTYVEKFIKRRLGQINMIGGGANSEVWCQIHADVFDRTIRQVKDPIMANVRGAAFLASISTGYLTVDDIPDHVKITRVFKPDPGNRKIYDELFREFLNIYKSNRKIYKRLNRI
ncbi:MAG: xylulose kinase [Proteobacteria bacterium]|nr:xylulose kinase [Pseudomonadota bacterium]